jgi:hypothetical protein
MQIGWEISTTIVEYHFWVKMNVKYHQFTMQIGWEISTTIVEYHFCIQIITCSPCKLGGKYLPQLLNIISAFKLSLVHHANWVENIYHHCRISFLGSNYHLFTMQIGWEISTTIVEYHFWVKMNVKYHQFTMQIGWEISTAIVEYHFWVQIITCSPC